MRLKSHFVYKWRRKQDLNPRERKLLSVFETDPFSLLGIPPCRIIMPSLSKNVNIMINYIAKNLYIVNKITMKIYIPVCVTIYNIQQNVSVFLDFSHNVHYNVFNTDGICISQKKEENK